MLYVLRICFDFLHRRRFGSSCRVTGITFEDFDPRVFPFDVSIWIELMTLSA